VAARRVGYLQDMVFSAGLLAVASCLLVVALTLTRKDGLANAVNIATLLSFAVALGAPIRALWRLRHPSSDPQAPSLPDIPEGEKVLARLVGSQWDHEADSRKLDTTDPIPVLWRVTRRADVMDHPDKLSIAALDMNASYDVNALTEKFRAMGHRRLVVLGDAGTGKTTLAVQMVRRLLKIRREHPDEPIPVLLPMASWDMDTFPVLQDWITARLAQDYPDLLAASLGPDMPKGLVDDGHILPVLDGLDELPEPAQSKVISTLNRDVRYSDPLIVTSRTNEFEEAVKAAADDVLAYALVIEPERIKPAVAADFLGGSLRGPEGSPNRAAWEPVLASLRADRPRVPPPGPAGMLAEFIATPLHLWLLRAVYIDPDDPHTASEAPLNPRDLLDPVKFPDDEALRAHLFKYLPAALIAARPPSKVRTDYSRPLRRYDPEDVARWLGYLAWHLTRRGTPNLRWSRLDEADDVPLKLIRTVAGSCAGLAFGLVIGIRFPLAIKIPLMLLGVLAGGLLFGVLGENLDAEPAYANLRLHKRFGLLVRKYRAAVKVPFLFAIGFGFAVAPIAGPITAATAGLAYAIAGTIMFGFADWITTKSVSDRAKTPPLQLRDDLRVTCVHVLGVGCAIGIAVGIVFGPAAGCLIAIAFGLTGSLGTTWYIGKPGRRRIPVAFGFGGKGTAGAAYCVTTVSLWARHRLPLRLMRFLDDAYRLNLLRTFGSDYQFRHKDLQDYFAKAYEYPHGT
jgi:hypothetical protein